MTLLTVTFAAVVSTIFWYTRKPGQTLKSEVLCFMYWGASLMWFVDAVFEFAELKTAYFNPSPADMLNDFFLGLSAVALGLVIWTAILLINDPSGKIKALFTKS